VKKPEFLAYELALKAGESIRLEVEALLMNGAAGGRVYAAILLSALDEEAGRWAWRALTADQSFIQIHPGGCTRYPPIRVSDFAADVLDAGSVKAGVKLYASRGWPR
jgi:hypothetical protein